MPESCEQSPCRHKSWLPHWYLAAGTGTSQLEPQQPLELLEELLAATQQVEEWLCVSMCNEPHDILLPCHDRNPLLACFLGLQHHAHSLHHAVAGFTGGTNCADGPTCTLLCCLGVSLVHGVGAITDITVNVLYNDALLTDNLGITT